MVRVYFWCGFLWGKGTTRTLITIIIRIGLCGTSSSSCVRGRKDSAVVIGEMTRRSAASGGALSVVRPLCAGNTAAASTASTDADVCGDGGAAVSLEAGRQRVPSGSAPFAAISVQLFRSSFTRRTRPDVVRHRRFCHLSWSWSIQLRFRTSFVHILNFIFPPVYRPTVL